MAAQTTAVRVTFLVGKTQISYQPWFLLVVSSWCYLVSHVTSVANCRRMATYHGKSTYMQLVLNHHSYSVVFACTLTMVAMEIETR